MNAAISHELQQLQVSDEELHFLELYWRSLHAAANFKADDVVLRRMNLCEGGLMGIRLVYCDKAFLGLAMRDVSALNGGVYVLYVDTTYQLIRNKVLFTAAWLCNPRKVTASLAGWMVSTHETAAAYRGFLSDIKEVRQILCHLVSSPVLVFNFFIV